jgi:hypothetical protein
MGEIGNPYKIKISSLTATEQQQRGRPTGKKSIKNNSGTHGAINFPKVSVQYPTPKNASFIM